VENQAIGQDCITVVSAANISLANLKPIRFYCGNKERK